MAPERAKNGGDQAIGRSRGGLTTKIHALVDAMGNPVGFSLTPGQASDLSQAEPLLENDDLRLSSLIRPMTLIAWSSP